MKNETCQARKNGKLVEMRVCYAVGGACTVHAPCSSCHKTDSDVPFPFVFFSRCLWVASGFECSKLYQLVATATMWVERARMILSSGQSLSCGMRANRCQFCHYSSSHRERVGGGGSSYGPSR